MPRDDAEAARLLWPSAAQGNGGARDELSSRPTLASAERAYVSDSESQTPSDRLGLAGSRLLGRHSEA